MHDDETTARPSPRAVERLADTVGSEVRDLRGSLKRALDEADRHEADGRQDLAVAVLEEQRELLVRVHQRLQTELAGAAVEREAESVLASVEAESVPVVAEVDEADVVRHLPAPVQDSGRAMVGRLFASAAAAVLGLALLLTPDGTVGQVSIAGARPSEPQPDAAGARAAEAAAAAQREAPTAANPATDADPTVGADPTTTGAAATTAGPPDATTGALAAQGDATDGSLDVSGLIEGSAASTPIPSIAPRPEAEAADEDDEAHDEEPAEGEDSRRPASQGGPDGSTTPPPDAGESDAGGGDAGGDPGHDRPQPVGGGVDAPAPGTPAGPQPSTPTAVGDGTAAASE